ncbi:MAG: (d)CMP kinase [bacterium]|nr:(d)CMP kinase [bacterium]
MKITIDGPAGSGKSTVAKLLADELGFFYIDSGSLYRSFAWYLEDVAVNDDTINNFKIDYIWEDGKAILKLGGVNISEKIRSEKISKRASEIASLEIVRNLVTRLQHEIAVDHDIIIEGRDAGTVVFPDADVKFFLTASIKARTKRRALELESKGEMVDFPQLEKAIQKRDFKDINRKIAPLIKAEGAIEVNTDGLKISEVVEFLKWRV